MSTFGPLFGEDVRRDHGFQAIAVSGVVAAPFGLHTRFGRFPLQEVTRLAVELAKNGRVIDLTSEQETHHYGIMTEPA